MSGNIIITGGNGLLGSSFKRKINDAFYPNRNEIDLLDKNRVLEYISDIKPSIVYHLAGKVGGVKANTENMYDFYTENVLMNTNIIDACVKNKVPKLVCCLSTCVYPDEKYVQYPLSEDQLHIGPPHESNYGYAYSKRMMDIHLKSVKQQHNLNYISLIPNNIYGENDNFDLERGHVIPALIRKVWEAKLNNQASFEVWGDGEIYREFTYVDDIRDALIYCQENYFLQQPLNIGNDNEYYLKDVIKLICKLLDYNGNISYNLEKPKGQVRKPSSNNKFRSIGWKNENYTSLEIGLQKTCNWFINNYPNIKGIKC